jgi:cytochrome o ubiquinol oxidase subunit 2
MEFNVDVVTPADYAAWVAKAKDSKSALDETRYRDLLKQSVNDPPATFKLADNTLFSSIVMQKLPPGPGPIPSVRPEFGDQNVR